jgi:hypothetical protein
VVHVVPPSRVGFGFEEDERFTAQLKEPGDIVHRKIYQCKFHGKSAEKCTSTRHGGRTCHGDLALLARVGDGIGGNVKSKYTYF